jgi:hypothetical protein
MVCWDNGEGFCSGMVVAFIMVILHLFSSLFPARQNLAGLVFFV